VRPVPASACVAGDGGVRSPRKTPSRAASSVRGSARCSGSRVARGAGCGAVTPAGQHRPARGPRGLGESITGWARATSPGSTGPPRPARRPCRLGRSSRLGDTGQDPPQRGDALGADGELNSGQHRGAGQLADEGADVGTQQYPSGSRRGGERREQATSRSAV
jgi:hypothetical protein